MRFSRDAVSAAESSWDATWNGPMDLAQGVSVVSVRQLKYSSITGLSGLKL